MPIYRGLHVPDRVSIGPGQKIDTLTGIVVTPGKSPSYEDMKQVENPLYGRINRLKEGDEFKIDGVSSFTTDKFMAEQFSRQEARGQRGRSRGDYRRYVPAVLVEVHGARGIPAAALSPWKQQEVLSRGTYRVKSVTKTLLPYQDAGPHVAMIGRRDIHLVLEAL
jgi:hypothetical protein